MKTFVFYTLKEDAVVGCFASCLYKHPDQFEERFRMKEKDLPQHFDSGWCIEQGGKLFEVKKIIAMERYNFVKVLIKSI